MARNFIGESPSKPPSDLADSRTKKPTPPQRRFQFTSRSLFVLVFVALCFFWGVRWLCLPYGWVTLIPVTILVVLGQQTRGWSAIGSTIGFLAGYMLGHAFLIGWDHSEPQYFEAAFACGAYGGCVGGGIQALLLKRWIAGSLVLFLSVLTFLLVLMYT